MKARLFNSAEDYERIAEWYAKWKYMPIAKDLVPEYGIIVSNESMELGALWIYRMEKGIGLLEGAIMNPDAPKKLRKGFQVFLMATIEELAKSIGCKQLWAISKDRFINKLCDSLGYADYSKDFRVFKKEI